LREAKVEEDAEAEGGDTKAEVEDTGAEERYKNRGRRILAEKGMGLI